MYRILIIEDDRGIAESIQEQASMWGFTAKCAVKFSNIMEEFAAFDRSLFFWIFRCLFIMDIIGVRRFGKYRKSLVIFISSASDNMNIVMAMNMGADDFIAKPFDMNVLIAKMQALLRRTYDFGNTVPVLEHRGAILNTGDDTLTYQEEKISLTKNEYRILLALMENKGKVVSRERLMERLWETVFYR